MGILMYELAHKRAPFLNEEFARKQTVSKMVMIKPSLNDELKDINRICLKKDP